MKKSGGRAKRVSHWDCMSLIFSIGTTCHIEALGLNMASALKVFMVLQRTVEHIHKNETQGTLIRGVG